LWRLADVLLLVFAAILLAVALRGLSSRVHRVVGNEAASLTIVVVLLITTAALVFLFFGAEISSQYDEIVQKAPAAIERIIGDLQTHALGRYFVQQVEGPTYQTRPDRSRRL